jgi:endo-alpha-1,4-polygalactosaminidase (GH114 family)
MMRMRQRWPGCGQWRFWKRIWPDAGRDEMPNIIDYRFDQPLSKAVITCQV